MASRDDLAKLVVKLEAQNTQYLKKLDQSEKRVKGFQKKNRKALQGISADFKKILGGVAVGALVVGIKRLTTETSKQIDQQAKFAQRIGVSTEALGGLEHAADLTGVSQQNLQLGLQRMTRRLAEAAQGTGEAKGAIKELGLEAEDLVKLSVDEQFIAIAGAMGQVDNQSDRVRLAMKLFDSEGVALVNTLKLGEQGLRDARQEAVKYGIALNETDTKKIEDANDALTRADAIWQGLANRLTIELAPTLADIQQDFAETFNDPSVIKGISDIARAVGVLATGAANLSAEFGGLGVQIAANAAAITGDLSAYDRLEQEIRDVDRALKGGLSTPLKFVGVDDSELNKLRESLVAQQQALVAGSQLVVSNIAELRGLDAKIAETARLLNAALDSEGRGFNQFGAIDAFKTQLDELNKRRDELAAVLPAPVTNDGAGSPDRKPSEPGGGTLGLSPIDQQAADAVQRKAEAAIRALEAKGASITASVLKPNELYIKQLAELDVLLGKNIISEQTHTRKQLEYKAALDESLGVTSQYEEALRIISENIDPLDAQLQALADDQSLLNKAFREGQITGEQFALTMATIDQKMVEVQDEAIKTGDDLSVFTDQAARNIQDSLGDAFNDLIQGTEDWEKQFLRSLLNIVSQAAAADLAALLTSGGGEGGEGGGNLAGIASAAGSLFGGFFADGGRPDPNKISIVGERGPELHIPDGLRGEIVPLHELGGQQQAQQVNVNAVTVLDPNEVASVLGSPEMAPTFINQVRLNRSAVRSALGLGLA